MSVSNIGSCSGTISSGRVSAGSNSFNLSFTKPYSVCLIFNQNTTHL
ncbi:hypothetical protein HOF65_05745 [bacterium]|nr:hypothetical protein [bacterium]MBT3853442.1 hypothetical protein [bacterium]MBT4632735.1 hypothetical protein [bacterium]